MNSMEDASHALDNAFSVKGRICARCARLG